MILDDSDDKVDSYEEDSDAAVDLEEDSKEEAISDPEEESLSDEYSQDEYSEDGYSRRRLRGDDYQKEDEFLRLRLPQRSLQRQVILENL